MYSCEVGAMEEVEEIPWEFDHLEKGEIKQAQQSMPDSAMKGMYW